MIPTNDIPCCFFVEMVKFALEGSACALDFAVGTVVGMLWDAIVIRNALNKRRCIHIHPLRFLLAN